MVPNESSNPSSVHENAAIGDGENLMRPNHYARSLSAHSGQDRFTTNWFRIGTGSGFGHGHFKAVSGHILRALDNRSTLG